MKHQKYFSLLNRKLELQFQKKRLLLTVVDLSERDDARVAAIQHRLYGFHQRAGTDLHLQANNIHVS